MRRLRLLRRLRNDIQGATAVEFAILSVPLFYLLLGVMEFGLITFTQVVVESALTQAARVSTIGATASDGCDRASLIIGIMKNKIKELPNNGLAQVTGAVVTHPGTSPTTASDICLDDPANAFPANCSNNNYFENNNIPGYQGGTPTTCLGSAGELVEIRVTYPWRIIMPGIKQFFGEKGIYVINTTIVIKNEPLL